MLQQGKLPISGQITFNFSEEALTLVSKGLSKQLTISSIISFPDQPSETNKRISVVVTKVHPPNTVEVDSKSFFPKAFFGNVLNNNSAKHAFGRMRDYLHNKIILKMGWLIVEYLDGPKKIPIMILYIPELKIGSYSFKEDSETMEEFDASLN